MSINVPDEIIQGIDRIIGELYSTYGLTGYKYIIGDPEGAHEKDFDDSGWQSSDKPVFFHRNQGVTWFRVDIKVPEYILDIPVEGSAARIMSKWHSPVKGYIDGELRFSEMTWMDFRSPEVYITHSAVPGTVHTAAFRFDLGEFCYFNDEFPFRLNFITDRAEAILYDLKSFKNELAYACGFAEVGHILPEVFEMVTESLRKDEGVMKLCGKIQAARELLEPMRENAKKNAISCIGHAHIDMNWFWSFEETLDVIRRDFSTMLKMMEETPDFMFAQSQCAVYGLAEIYYPELFAQIKARIKSANWEVTASAWVENDMNMPSGESIVRHILYSKKYLRDKFGIDTKIMWAPDTFGHAASLPQILKKGGVDYYMPWRCRKINEFLSWWEGIDGTKIMVFSPGHAVDFESGYWRQDILLTLGMGDHGGGPNRRDVARIKKFDSYPTTPSIKFGGIQDFLDNMLEQNPSDYPVHKGEMNFVFEGCYTSHADIKKYNRLCENRLYDTEALNTFANLYGMRSESAKIEECWKTALFSQFHDIIDGCGARETYRYSGIEAEKALGTLAGITDESVKFISGKIKAGGGAYAVFNTTGWKRDELVKIDGEYIFVKDIPPMGYKVIEPDKPADNPEYKKINEFTDENTTWKITYLQVETAYYYMEIKKDSGEIVTLYDKKNKKYIAEKGNAWYKTARGILNTMQVYHEMPAPASAWTISGASRIDNLVRGAKTIIKEDGPLLKIINVTHEFGGSVISQDIMIYEDKPRIDFVTHVDWNETGAYEKDAPMLKVCFTPDINNTCAAYEIAYAAIERANTDMEVPALRWADIYDGEYGLSVLNDCKYGYRTRGNTIELTLVRSSWEPDAEADKGSHDFIYSLLPHKSGWNECGTVRESSFLNNGVIISKIEPARDAFLPESYSLLETDNGNIAISAFKPAESGDGYILRVYESGGMPASVKIRLGFDICGAEETDLNEKSMSKVAHGKRELSFDMKSFEIKTFKLKIY
jgi:alpha-mannosidase